MSPNLFASRLGGVIGMLATATLVVADLVMLYAPPRGARSPVEHFAVAISRHRLILGDYLGLLALPFVLVGLLHVYVGLRSAGFWLAIVPVGFLGYAYVLGAAFHHGVALVVSAQQEFSTATPLAGQFLRPLLTLFTIIAVSGAILLFLVLLTGRATYPSWMAWLSPLVTSALFFGLGRLGPPMFAVVLVPAGHNLAMLIFFACSSVVLWR